MKTLIILAMLFGNISWAAGEDIVLKKDKGTVLFEAIGRPSMMKIKGHGQGAEGTLKVQDNSVSGDLSFELSTLDTGMTLRNQHMKEKYLETAKHPKAFLALKNLTMPSGWSKQNSKVAEASFEGELTLHGEKRPVQGTFEITGDKELKAKMEIKISEYKIDIPSYLGVTVTDVVKIQVTAKDLF